MSYDPFQALYSGTGGVLLLLLTTIESTYPTVCIYIYTHKISVSLKTGQKFDASEVVLPETC